MGLPRKQWKDKHLIQCAIDDAAALGGFTLIEVSHGNNGQKRHSVLTQRAYWRGYGIPDDYFAYGIATARNNGYYPKGLDFFMRLDHLDEGLLKQNLEELTIQARRHLPLKKALQLKKFTRTSPHTLADIMYRRPEAMEEWDRRYVIPFERSTNMARGWLLEQYVQTIFTERLAERDVPFAVYHNVGIARPEEVPDGKETLARDSDIVICAPMLEVLHATKALRDEYQTRINRRWGNRVSQFQQLNGKRRK